MGQGLVGDRLDGRQGVLHPVVQLLGQQRPVLLAALALGHVEGDARHAQRLAVGVVEGLAADLEPAHLAGRRTDPVLDVVVAPVLDRLADRRLHPVAVFRQDRVDQVLEGERVARLPAEVALAAVGGHEPHAVEVEGPGAQPRRLEDEVQPLLAAPQGLRAPLDLLLQGIAVALQAHQPLALQRHVELRGEVVGQLALVVEDRRDEEAVPERLARLLVVLEVDLDRDPALDRVAHPGDVVAVGLGTLQEAAVAAEDLVPGVAGELREGVVDEDDRFVGLVRVGDQHRHPRRPHGRAANGSELAPTRVSSAAMRFSSRRSVTRRSSLARPSEGARLPLSHEQGSGSVQRSGPLQKRTSGEVGSIACDRIYPAARHGRRAAVGRSVTDALPGIRAARAGRAGSRPCRRRSAPGPGGRWRAIRASGASTSTGSTWCASPRRETRASRGRGQGRRVTSSRRARSGKPASTPSIRAQCQQ